MGASVLNTYALEMSLAGLMIACGTVLMMPGDTFSLSHYSSLHNWIPEMAGGSVLAAIGFARVAAILRNGRTSYTPVIRIFGCSMGAGFWASVFVAVELSYSAESTPLILGVAFVAILAELYSALRGGADAHALDSLGLRQRKAGRVADAHRKSG